MIDCAPVTSITRLRWVMAVVITVFLVLTGFFSIVNYYRSLEAAENASLMRLNGIVYTLSMQIDGDAHQRLMKRYEMKDQIVNSKQDTDYLAIHGLLRRICTANMLNTPIYTVVPDSNQHFSFGVTSAEIPYFRHLYRSAPSMLMEKRSEGAMIPHYKDEFGVWLSAFAAVRNSKGEVVALVLADQKFDDFLANLGNDLLKSLAFGLVTSGILLLFLVNILKPIIQEEIKAKEAISSANQQINNVNEQLQISFSKISELDNFRREMVANLSHDLRTPLASILGFLETIIDKNEQISNEEREQFTKIALSEANRLNGLVNNLFELSTLESKQIQISPEVFQIAELAQDILQKYQVKAADKNIKLLTDFSEGLPLTKADVRLIDRLLQNLMDNALAYAGNDGFIMFTIFEKEGKLHFKVCNSGDPIPEAHLDKVFDRYFKSSNRKKESTGLGLTIVKKIVELHGELVWAETVNDITTFRFTLPIYKGDN